MAAPLPWWRFSQFAVPLQPPPVIQPDWLKKLSTFVPFVNEQANILMQQMNQGGSDGSEMTTAAQDFASPSEKSSSSISAVHVLLTVLYAVLALGVLSYSFGWLFWLLLSMLLTVLQLIYALYQLIRIVIDVSLFSTIKFWSTVVRIVRGRTNGKAPANRRRKSLLHSKSLKSFESLAALNEAEERETVEWRESTRDLPQARVLEKTTARLKAAREASAYDDLQFLLSGLLKRGHLNLCAAELHSRCAVGSKYVVDAFQAEVEACLAALVDDDAVPLPTKLAFFKKERRALGQSALCLSGGGSICMYHIGTLKALMDAGLYDSIRVLSGTSGGSIIAAMAACKTDEELKAEVITDKVSTDFTGDGSQARLGIRWFPPLKEQLKYFLSHRCLMDSREFKRCCDWYYKDVTFAEAYARTKRHVSISVSFAALGGGNSGAGSSSGDGGPGRLLLNHISSPHVTLASAVAASCALPGIMNSATLEAKDSSGKVVAFEVDGVTYVDGSLSMDLPFKRMATLFNVSNFIVSQVNFHVLPFVRKEHTSATSVFWKALRFLELDIRHRASRLAKLGLLPTFFGQSINGVVKQKYHGDVTMVPKFTPMESIGLKAVLNPTVRDMKHYIRGGELAAWPHINRIRFMLRTETCLRECVRKLQAKLIAQPYNLRPPSHRFELSSLQSVNNFQLHFPGRPSAAMEVGNQMSESNHHDNDDDDDDGYDDDVDDDGCHGTTDGDSGALSIDADSAGMSQVQTSSSLRRVRPLSSPSKFLNRSSSNGSSKQSPRRKKDRSWSEGLVRHDADIISAQLSRETTEALRWEMSLLTKEVSHLRAENEQLRASLSDIGAIADAAALARVVTTPEKSCGPL